MFIIVNKQGERMFQFSQYRVLDAAMRCLNRARERNPLAGFRLEEIPDAPHTEDYF